MEATMTYPLIPSPTPEKLPANRRDNITVDGYYNWDDGCKYDGVTKIYVKTYNKGIQFVMFDYVKDGEGKRGHLLIPDHIPITHEIVIDHPKEYLVSVQVWYSDNYIQTIQFRTNVRTHEAMGSIYNYDSYTLEVKDKKIIGFHGSADRNGTLTFIGAYFVPRVLEAGWDDGKHAKVKKVRATYSDEAIYSIQVTYDGTALPSQLHGTDGPQSDEFTLESDEYITGLSAYGKPLGSQDIITALTFTTNKSTYGFYAHKTSFKISAPTGKQIAGFLGRSGFVLNSIDAHYAPVPEQELDARETKWDDGSDHDGVTKIHVRSGANGIQSVQFEYVQQDGQTKEGDIHASEGSGRISTREITINHPEEYLVSVEGWSDSSNVIMGIRFKTNQKTDHVGNDIVVDDTKFTLPVEGQKIVGFHGSSAIHGLSSIGAHFVPKVLAPVGDDGKDTDAGETEWNDGSDDHEGVTEINVRWDSSGILSVQFDYVRDGKAKKGATHGSKGSGRVSTQKIVINHPEEYLVSVEGWSDSSNVIMGIQFKTNQKTYDDMGNEFVAGDTKFTLQGQGQKIVGFHGSSGTHLNSIKAHHFALNVTKITAVGGT